MADTQLSDHVEWHVIGTLHMHWMMMMMMLIRVSDSYQLVTVVKELAFIRSSLAAWLSGKGVGL